MDTRMTRSRYQQIRRLARGGMGEVILARQQGEQGVDRLVALKCIRQELSQEADFQRLFQNEMRVAARLSHPNVVHVYDFGIDDHECFLAMEYVAGKTLSRIIREARKQGIHIPIDAAIAVAIDAAKGLHYAHELTDENARHLEIVHRDVAPENIMISFGGVAKVLDFGIANARITDRGTKNESLMGHLNYMSPEQLTMGEVDRRADIYALGLILWDMTVGYRLHAFGNPLEAALMITKDSLPDEPALCRGPPGWEGIIRRAIASDRKYRYTTALELQRDIEYVAKSAGIGVSNLSCVRLLARLFPESSLVTPAPTLARRLTVLAVDDEGEMIHMMRRCLQRAYEVEFASDVETALKMLAASPFDIVIVDERMPGGRGTDILAQVAETSPDTVRIMVTGYADTDLMLEAINRAQVNRFLIKPFRAEELLDAVTSAARDLNLQAQGSLHSEFQKREPRAEQVEETKTAGDLTFVDRNDSRRNTDEESINSSGRGAILLPWANLGRDCGSTLLAGDLLAVLFSSQQFGTQTLDDIVMMLDQSGVVVSWQHTVANCISLLFKGGAKRGEFIEASLNRALMHVLPAQASYGTALSPISSLDQWVQVGHETETLAKARLWEALPHEP